jgi:TonB family protein
MQSGRLTQRRWRGRRRSARIEGLSTRPVASCAMPHRSTLVGGILVLAFAALAGAGLGASAVPQAADSVTAAHELYAAAAYREALLMLERLETVPETGARDRAVVAEYRALCLIALNRLPEATTAIEEMIRRDPLFTPAEEDMAPRIRRLFDETRQRVMPSIAQDRYTAAKTEYEEGRKSEAAAGFDDVLAIIDAIPGGPPPLMTDLRVLAAGFRQLAAPPVSQVKTEPAPASAATAAPPPAQPVQAPVQVTPPQTVQQAVPPWPRGVPLPPTPTAIVEIVIGKDGRVQDVRLQRPVEPRYDRLLLDAARQWVYKPALRDGQPTPFVKTVRIDLSRAR